MAALPLLAVGLAAAVTAQGPPGARPADSPRTAPVAPSAAALTTA
jgi:hypothetical protein